ncbi:hypothetical protein OJAV_G00038580 [Oryzias javanicus]|uniref:Uncharacterized protein n=1 Tax=Oryzias javanicus TaxID=123683 RepID=A0A437DHA4_ORYJA|nr:hypothetical protein OJAV_G00038580 [Oryzias javanicus]
MSAVQCLRDFISVRLTAAAEEILSEFEKTIVRYEEEIARQRRLLDTSWKTQSPTNSAVLSEHHGSTDEDLCDKDANTSVKEEEPQIKEEVEELCISQDEELPDLKEETDSLLIPAYEDDRCLEHYLNIHQGATLEGYKSHM